VTKAKCDQTIGIRLELQKHEREQLETLVNARALGDVLNGVGAVIAPFGDVLSVIIAAIIAKEGAEWLGEKLNEERVRRKWLAERKKKGDYRRWKMAQDLLGRVLWFVDLEDTEPT